MDTQIKNITPADSIVPIFLQEPTAEELEQRQKEHEQHQQEIQRLTSLRQSAISKLINLGLTEEEISTLRI
jgi:DNA-binding NarL/FixJ family response regulator